MDPLSNWDRTTMPRRRAGERFEQFGDGALWNEELGRESPRDRVPSIARLTSYGRSRIAAKMSILRAIRPAPF